MKTRTKTTQSERNHATALLFVASVFLFLIFCGWRRNEWDKDLIQAVKQNDVNTVRVLLDRGADPNVNVYEQYPILAPFKPFVGKANDFHYPALLDAIVNGHSDIAQELLRHGANPNATDNFEVPALHWAVYMGDNLLVEALLKRGAAVNGRDSQGKTALSLAQQRNHPDIVRILKHKGGIL